MILYSWLGIDTNNNCLEYLRRHACQTPNWVKYNLVDGMWMLSYLLFMEGFWGNDEQIKLLFYIPVVAFAFIVEILQYYGCFPGTGDILDILFYVAAIMLFILLIKLKQMCYEKNI